jgi:hypothetical protein
MRIRSLLDRLEDAENQFVGQEFLAPIIHGGEVKTRIAAVQCRLKVTNEPPGGNGWGIFRALSTSLAAWQRKAPLAAVRRYLDLFPAVGMIAVRPMEQTPGRPWLALTANQGDRRIQLRGPVPIYLVEEGLQAFDVVIARFDGSSFWFDRRDASRDPSIASYLREKMNLKAVDGLPPETETLRKRGLTREEREAYRYVRSEIDNQLRQTVGQKLGRALRHAGGALEGFQERDDVYTVRYRVGEREHQSVIRKEDFTVVSAGICLSGEDQRFDLTSLVSVLREGERNGELVWAGGEELND